MCRFGANGDLRRPDSELKKAMVEVMKGCRIENRYRIEIDSNNGKRSILDDGRSLAPFINGSIRGHRHSIL